MVLTKGDNNEVDELVDRDEIVECFCWLCTISRTGLKAVGVVGLSLLSILRW